MKLEKDERTATPETLKTAREYKNALLVEMFGSLLICPTCEGCGQVQSNDPALKPSITPLLQKIIEICDAGSAQEFGDADERLRAIRGLIIGEAV